jgi:uncharacterized membrane protein (DUF4010 family)
LPTPWKTIARIVDPDHGISDKPTAMLQGLNPMATMDLFERLGLALAIGLLFGIERGWREREGRPGSRAAGIRTFALIGLLGGVWGVLSNIGGELLLGFGALAFAAWFGYFEWKEEEAAGNRSATGFVAGLAAFALGAFACRGDKAAAASAAVAATFILAERRVLHSFLEKLKWVELRAALLLLVMTFVLLPVLPDAAIDAWGAINPYQLWLLTILTAAVSYGGYIAVRLEGGRNGLLFGGATGGLVSSTTVTWTFARMAKRQPHARLELAAGVTASWTISLLRMAAIAVALAPTLTVPLGMPVLAAAVVTASATAVLFRRSGAEHALSELKLEDPFDIWMILRFVAVLAIVMLAGKLLAGLFGEGGLIGLAAISGLADVDPITLSMAKQVGTAVDASGAALVILTAALANLFAKCAFALHFGGRGFFWPVGATAIGAVVAACPTLLASS